MARLVIVSNRVALPSEHPPGGFALAMRTALRETGGLWFGWSGRVAAGGSETLHRQQEGNVSFLTLDFTRREHADFYAGFANRTLWPLLHFRPGLVDFSRNHWDAYLSVNTRFAEHLARLVQPDDLVWVHDYHLIPLAAMLRAREVRARLGFFLHTPLPPPELLELLPIHRELFESLADYDLVGFHTTDYLRAFHGYLRQHAGAEINESGMISVRGGRRSLRTGVFPIGIDVREVESQAQAAVTGEECTELSRSLAGRALIIGVDRLDYSKGLVERFRAFGELLDRHPEHRRQVTMLQIAPPSRTEVSEYRRMRRELERIAGAINGRLAEPDWTPLRYVNQSYTQAALAGFYRLARIGFVTPLRDGMNLVAKEYIASQDPEDPGALVLSRFAGAARELDDAILVNPYDIEGMAASLHAGLVMSRDDRRKRWARMMDVLREHDITAWRQGFLAALSTRSVETALACATPR